MNILANCRKHFPLDKKDPTKASPVNPQGYILDPKWDTFLRDWLSLLEAPSKAEYQAQLVCFRIHSQAATMYVEST